MLSIMSVILCVLCLGAIITGYVKNKQLIEETKSARKEYLSVKSNNLRLESHFSEAMQLFKETRSLNDALREDMLTLQKQNRETMQEITDMRYTIQKQSGLILEMNERIENLEYDNERLKRKLNLQDEVVKHSKVVIPFRATI